MPEKAYLLVVTNEKDDDGFPVETTKKIPVYVREKSATRLEFYEAMRSGLYVSRVFEVRVEDYELSARKVDGRKTYATQIEYDGETFDIFRTYKADKAMIQLICGTGGMPYVR